MKNYLGFIDTDTRGPRYDVTPLFANSEAFSRLIQDLSLSLKETEFDCVAGIDALGFILGSALAVHFKKGFLAIRKAGKLPVETDREVFSDYTGQRKSLELQTNAINNGTRILLTDEWIETGAQVQAAINLIERQGGIVAGIAAINIDENENTQRLTERYSCHAIWTDF